LCCKVALLFCCVQGCVMAQYWKLAPPSGLPSNWTKHGTTTTTKWSLEPAEHSVLAAKKTTCFLNPPRALTWSWQVPLQIVPDLHNKHELMSWTYPSYIAKIAAI
jgi:hypothetical protein